VLGSSLQMRRVLAISAVAALAAVAAGCGGGGGGGGSSTTTASSCSKSDLKLVTPGTLTIGTGNPAYPPWYEGGEKSGSAFKVDDPTTGQGYESAVAYAIAKELGFTKSQVKWVPVAFNLTFKPGPKNFDFAMQQISFSPQRQKAVTFSRSYYNVNQALVALKDKPIAKATTLSDLKDAKLGAVVGTTSYQYITDNIKPTSQPLVYDTLDANVAALKNGQIDGLVTDFPSAYYIANVQLSNATIVGRFPTVGSQEFFGATFEKRNPLAACVNKAIRELRQNGTIDQLEQKWITSRAHAPLMKQ
jgi:polar amino acid transport system substrate-binding protein